MPQIFHDRSRRYTVEEVLAFPDDGNRYELIDGELLVSPSPRFVHQAVLAVLHLHLGNYMARFGLAHTVFFAPADITWGPKTLVQPDLFIIRPEEISEHWTTVQHLRLAVEVISPSTAGHDRIKKRHIYQRQQVETYWIVDPYERAVEVWTPTASVPTIVTDVLEWRHSAESDPLRLQVSEIVAFPSDSSH